MIIWRNPKPLKVIFSGVKLIEMTKETDKTFAQLHSTSDGLVEAFGVSSSFHIAQLQVGLTKPLKLGRAKDVRVSYHTNLHDQLKKINILDKNKSNVPSTSRWRAMA